MELQEQNPNFKMVPVMTGMDPSTWTGLTGHLTAQILTQQLSGLASPVYYIAGPPGMVRQMRQLLTNTGVDDDDIRTEEFSGYE